MLNIKRIIMHMHKIVVVFEFKVLHSVQLKEEKKIPRIRYYSHLCIYHYTLRIVVLLLKLVLNDTVCTCIMQGC